MALPDDFKIAMCFLAMKPVDPFLVMPSSARRLARDFVDGGEPASRITVEVNDDTPVARPRNDRLWAHRVILVIYGRLRVGSDLHSYRDKTAVKNIESDEQELAGALLVRFRNKRSDWMSEVRRAGLPARGPAFGCGAGRSSSSPPQ